MPDLSLHHIEQISRDINRQEITFSHLLEDLIDHVCCDVENEMKRGLNFAEAYQRVKQKMGSRRLKEIQEETLYLVDTKYRNMKNTMKISGVAGTIIFGFAALFKIQHWPGAGIMMTFGALILAFVFLPSALGVLWKETHSRKRLLLFISGFFAGTFFILGTLFKIQHWPASGIILSLAALSGILFFIPALALSRLTDQENRAKRPVYILGAIGMICYALGMLFKIQHWPLASFLMASGVFILCVIAFPWYTWLTWKEDNHINARFIFIVIGSLLIIAPGALINLNLQDSYNEIYYSHQVQQQALFNYRYSYNQSLMTQYRDSSNYQKMEQLHSKTTGLLSVIFKIQTKMVEKSEGKPNMPEVTLVQIRQIESGPEIQYKLLSKPFQPDLVREFLLPGCISRQELNRALAEYINYLSGLTSAEDLRKFKGLLDPSIYLPTEIPENGEISLMAGLHSLELLKNSLLTVESYMLITIAKN
jgi:hypothetical protein